MKIIQDDDFYMDDLFAQIRSIATSLERIADSLENVLSEIHEEQREDESNSCTCNDES
jgi:hypothetical protein|tara:strand:- start:3561 stop:3734 length:174 start_codon:yes stop_codon:yes gene_type:complete